MTARSRPSASPSFFTKAQAGRCPAASASGSPWPAPWCAGPEVFLMDEPLSNLDAKLGPRPASTSWAPLRVGTTFVYVTHDQVEAMTMADRMARHRRRPLQQVGEPQGGVRAPRQPLRGPLHRQPPMNTIDGEVTEAGPGPGASRIPFQATCPSARRSSSACAPSTSTSARAPSRPPSRAVEWLGHEPHHPGRGRRQDHRPPGDRRGGRPEGGGRRRSASATTSTTCTSSPPTARAPGSASSARPSRWPAPALGRPHRRRHRHAGPGHGAHRPRRRSSGWSRSASPSTCSSASSGPLIRSVGIDAATPDCSRPRHRQPRHVPLPAGGGDGPAAARRHGLGPGMLAVPRGHPRRGRRAVVVPRHRAADRVLDAGDRRVGRDVPGRGRRHTARRADPRRGRRRAPPPAAAGRLELLRRLRRAMELAQPHGAQGGAAGGGLPRPALVIFYGFFFIPSVASCTSPSTSRTAPAPPSATSASASSPDVLAGDDSREGLQHTLTYVLFTVPAGLVLRHRAGPWPTGG